ncbi:AMP binding protein [Mycena rebaudengoi]|nr:AMP binding protein [Mycena rebaudengoi]
MHGTLITESLLLSAMAPKIYKSHLPDHPILATSVYTRIFSPRGSGDVGGFPPSRRALIDAASGTVITRAQLKDLTLSLGYGLRNHPNTRALAQRGDTVLIYSQNSLAWPVVLFGCVAAGLRCTPANNAYTSQELAHQYRDSGAKLVFTAEGGINTGNDLQWAGGPAAARDPESAGFLAMEDLLGKGKLDQEEKFEGSLANETLFLCYSSGTTGKPKGVETTHQNITTLLDIVTPLFPPMWPEQPMIGILPFYHIYGIANLITSGLFAGIPVVIQIRFDPVQFCANIEKYKVSFAFVVPPILVVLARHPAVDNYDLSSLKYMLSGAAPLGADLVKMVKQRLLAKCKPGSSCTITQGYGLTETSPSSHSLRFDDADRKCGSIGELLPNLEARLVVDADGDVDAEEGQPGELWLRGKTVMKGYLNNPAATSNAITADKWFKTGDVAIRDQEGHFYIVDRLKELIKYKGFQVPPAELESVLLAHPEIADAAVIGVESVEQATELPRAYICPAHPEKLETPEAKAQFAQSIIEWMETKVARHKFLRGGVQIIDAVPKSAAGKILRRQLRDLAKQEAARGLINTGFKSKL